MVKNNCSGCEKAPVPGVNHITVRLAMRAAALLLVLVAAALAEELGSLAEERGALAEEARGRELNALTSAWSQLTGAASGVGDSLVQGQVSGWVRATGEALKDYLKPVTNLAYVAVMLYGFAKLPANFMLVVGLLTVTFGPFVLGWVFALLGQVVAAAAYAPFIIIVCAWVVVFLKSALFQRLALTVGLDYDGSGQVDGMDLLHAASQTKVGTFLRLREVYETLIRVPSTIKYEHGQIQRPILERLDRIEVLITPGGKVSRPKAQAEAPARNANGSGGAQHASNGSSGSPRGEGFLTATLGLPSLPAMPKWASPQGSEAFAAKQRERAQKGKKPGWFGELV